MGGGEQPTMDWAANQERPQRAVAFYEQPAAMQAGARSPVPSHASNATAIRIRLAEEEAEEELLRIKQQELELQKERVKAKLRQKLASIEAESQAGSITGPHAKVDDWLRRTAADQPTPPPPKHEPRRRSPPPPFEPKRRNSPPATPARERSASGQRGIEKLAEALEKMARVRPPPRQVYELPAFSGAAGEWLPFQAAYAESTRAYNFTPHENMARLRSCLRGTAREAVEALLHTSANPEAVMTTLRQCFGRPEILATKALDDLKKLPRLGSTATEINAFAVKLQNIVSVLSSIDQHGYLASPLLVRDVMEKLSPHLRSRFGDFASEQMTMEPQIILLSRFLMREADRALRFSYTTVEATAAAAATTLTFRRDAARPAPRPTPMRGPPSGAPRAPVYATEGDDARRCLCCGGGHPTTRCKRITNMEVNDRWQWARDNRVCFRCMDQQHRRETCRARTCEVNGCRHVHHPLLHASAAKVPRHPEARRERTPPRGQAPQSPTTLASEPTVGPAPIPEKQTVTTVSNEDGKSPVLLKMCRVRVSGPSGTVDTFALLDDGSTVTLIDEDLARTIGASGPAVPMQMRGIASNTELPNSRRVNITVQGHGEAYKIAARTVDNLRIHTQRLGQEVTRYRHLSGLNDACYDEAIPRLLIGADNWHLMLVHETRTGKRRQPAAVRTALGWVIYGSVPRAIRAGGPTEDVLYVYNVRDDATDKLVQRHFAIDALGVSLATKPRPAEERAKRLFEATVKFHGDHYEVGLPWITDEVQTPASYATALQRFKGIERKMRRDANFAQEYAAQVTNLIAKGYAEPATEADARHPRAWVLPHFAVRNPNKPGKLRLVFDAASRSQGRCLNDFLLEGPDLLKSLPGILLRFREGRYAVTADIKEMFLRVKIRPEDRPAQLFLWREPGENQPKLMKMTSMIFGAASSPFLAHSVRNHNAERHAPEFPQALYAITSSHYMDDLVDSYATEEEAVDVATAVNEVHLRAGFELRGWNTNSPKLERRIEPELRATAPATLGLSEGPKILGLIWDPRSDTLGFNTAMNRVPKEVREGTRTPTKREALSAVMSVYDPLGLLSPYTITAKVTLQQSWRKQAPWDEPLDLEDGGIFIEWARGLAAVAALQLERCYAVGRHELHAFTDASESAYATAIYLRTTDASGTVTVALVAGKAKVAPLRQQSIPRMELQAALIGARLAATIIAEQRLTIERVVFWTDSRTVLAWIRNDAKRYTPFVAHRLGEIAEITRPEQWRWVPTAANPADDATRADSARQISTTDRWFTGPDFLRLPEDQWPQETVSEIYNINADASASENVKNKSVNLTSALPNIERFSKFERLIKATARVIFFVDKCRDKDSQLEVRHIERAEHLWFRKLPKKSSLFHLDPVLEDGLLRLRGRINAAPVPDATKRPVILNGRHPFVSLLIEKAHRDAHHSSNERVVNDLRQRLWVLHLRPTVKKVARACRTCAVRRSTPRPPAMGDLPRARIDPYSRPFTNCGVDYFGPLTVTIGRRHEKRWVALFTCLTTRAVHLEIVASLSTDSAIMALRRMAARRGWPRVMYSDNGTCFRGPTRSFAPPTRSGCPSSATSDCDTAWNGGSSLLELLTRGRLGEVGAVSQDRTDRHTLSRAPKEEVLVTLLAEAEQTVNARPLTHVSVDPATRRRSRRATSCSAARQAPLPPARATKLTEEPGVLAKR
ncbi:uncharacterized protein [Choristoneura fumiferana]|uniref:uncharacterized protein n=1 Tax=Choristoneura fumiferana TaxID=7141 RepID=UPI003D1598E4